MLFNAKYDQPRFRANFSRSLISTVPQTFTHSVASWQYFFMLFSAKNGQPRSRVNLSRSLISTGKTGTLPRQPPSISPDLMMAVRYIDCNVGHPCIWGADITS